MAFWPKGNSRPRRSFRRAPLTWVSRNLWILWPIGVLAAWLLQSAGVIHPLDWWGTGMEVGR